ncbi:MAG: glycoside hydrolase family 3 N-terminal domain-containing protein [Balneolaceae bacterium]
MLYDLYKYFLQAMLPSFSLLSLLLIVAACSTTEPAVAPDEPIPDLPEPVVEKVAAPGELVNGVSIDSLLAGLSLREKIGQLFVVPANGRFTGAHDPSYLRLKQLVQEAKVGGLIFMRGDVYGQAVMTNELQALADIPLWITQDMEFGAAMRVDGTTRFTPAMGIAATGSATNAYLKGKITAREAKALGVHQIFAPVLDVNNNPDNPVINVRSFGSLPGDVTRFGQYFIDGVESEGVMATAKHFPGHGDTDVDSHLALPTIPHGWDRLSDIELEPFRITINQGLRSVMSAHITYPQISSHIGRPGTLDESILNRILIDSLGFNGLVVTDGLNMRGITDHFSPGEAVVLSLLAGADMMLISPDVLSAIDEVEAAVHDGRITEERIDQSARKILTLKAGADLFSRTPIDIETLNQRINPPLYQSIADRIARQSVTILKDDKGILPIRDIDFNRVMVLTVADDRSGTTGSALARELRNYHANVQSFHLDRRTGAEERREILQAARDADLLVIGSFIMVRSHQPIQLPDEFESLLRTLTRLSTPSVLIAFGNPYLVRDLPQADVQVLAWSSDQNQVVQTVPALVGASTVQGRIPVDIPGHFSMGDGVPSERTALRIGTPEQAGMSSDKLLEIDRIMHRAIRDSVFPGGVVGVAKNGVMVWNHGYGYHDYTKTRAVSEQDVYDIASVTKIMATTAAVMKLVDEGSLSLDDRISAYIPEFGEGRKREITIRHLLLHTSGLPAFRTYVDVYQTRGEILNAIRSEPLINEPGAAYVYSDLGFILLAEIVEKVSGLRIDRYVRNRLYFPMGMISSHFNPKQVGRWMSNRIPPTEIDDVYLRGTVQAEVHDERAWFMDGVAGHAGLFSTTRDMAIFAQMLHQGGIYAGQRYFSEETVTQFRSRQSELSGRGFGFDRKSEGFSSAGERTGPETFGHLGFTGTSIWMDPDQEVTIILLTNRTYPHRDRSRGISRIRAEIADAVMNSIEE